MQQINIRQIFDALKHQEMRGFEALPLNRKGEI